MKVMVFTDSYSPSINGVSKQITPILQSLTNQGIEVFVVAPKYNFGPHNDPIDGFGLSTVLRVENIRKDKKKISEFVKRHAPDLIHIVTYGSIGTFASKQFVNGGIPIIHSLLEDIRSKKGTLGSWIAEQWQWYRIRNLTKRSRAVLVPSNYWKTVVEQHGVGSTTVWHPGVDTSFYNPHKRDKLYSDGFQFLVTNRKNDVVIEDAWERCYDKLSKAWLLFGNRDECGSTENKMKYIGYVSNHVLASADMLLCSAFDSIDNISILKAMASGLPVIAVDAGAVKDIVDVAPLSVYALPDLDSPIDWAFAMMSLYDNSEVREAMQSNALQFVYNNYSEDKKIQELIKIYTICLFHKK